jgi:ketosteroid isomerase-like protein
LTSSGEKRVELLRRGIQAYNASDTGAVLALLHRDVVIVNSDALLNSGTFQGHDGYRKWVGQWHEAWELFQNIPEEIVPVGERHVVARVRGGGRGRASGLEVEMEVGWVYEMRDDLCVFMSIQPSFEVAMAMAREREGIAAESGGD